MAGNLFDDLQTAARGYAQGKGLKVLIKTNLGPAITVYDADAPDSGPGLVKAGVILTDRTGNEITTYGKIPKTDWLIVGALVTMVTAAGVLMVKGIMK